MGSAPPRGPKAHVFSQAESDNSLGALPSSEDRPAPLGSGARGTHARGSGKPDKLRSRAPRSWPSVVGPRSPSRPPLETPAPPPPSPHHERRPNPPPTIQTKPSKYSRNQPISRRTVCHSHCTITPGDLPVSNNPTTNPLECLHSSLSSYTTRGYHGNQTHRQQEEEKHPNSPRLLWEPALGPNLPVYIPSAL